MLAFKVSRKFLVTLKEEIIMQWFWKNKVVSSNVRSLSKHNETPTFWGFNFRFVWFSGCPHKNFLKKFRKRIYRNKGHFRSLHMLVDLWRKNEGNPFFTKIWVRGSYTDTLLRRLKTVSSTFQDEDFHGSLLPLFISLCYNHDIKKTAQSLVNLLVLFSWHYRLP